MTILIACDKFKGSLSAASVCRSIANGIRTTHPFAKIKEMPLADGGDGTLAILEQQLQYQQIHTSTTDPLGRGISVAYLSNGSTAFIELAQASGIRHLQKNELDILHTSTEGTGWLLKDAIDKGHKEIVLSIGGSCTNDLGIGILSVLGFQFLDKDEQALKPIGGNLLDIKSILSPVQSIDYKLTILCDVDNPLYGPQGAAKIYGPQKGATVAEINYLDKAAIGYSEIIKEEFGKDIAGLNGGGAAGGIAAGLFGMLSDVSIIRGFDFIADVLELEEHIQQADFVITGEGKFDEQSLRGKVVGRMMSLCRSHKKPLSIIAGSIDLSGARCQSFGIKSYHTLIERAGSIDDSIANAEKYLEEIAAEIF